VIDMEEDENIFERFLADMTEYINELILLPFDTLKQIFP